MAKQRTLEARLSELKGIQVARTQHTFARSLARMHARTHTHAGTRPRMHTQRAMHPLSNPWPFFLVSAGELRR